MKKEFFVEKVKCTFIQEQGYPCAPCETAVLISLKYRKNKEKGWLYVLGLMDFFQFYQSKEDITQTIVKARDSDGENEQIEEENYMINEFEGINLEDSDNLVETLTECADTEAGKLINLLMISLLCSIEDFEEIKEISKKQYVKDIDLSLYSLENYIL